MVGKKSKKRILAVGMAAMLAMTSMAALAATGSAQPRVDSLEVERYNKGYTYVEVDLEDGVFTSSSKVTVKNAAGDTMKSSLVFDFEDDKNHKYDEDVVIKVQGLEEGEEYSFTITQVRKSGKNYSVTGSFEARTGYEYERD